MGQPTLTIIGTAIGFAIGGPQGAKWGYMAGSMAGAALYPPKAKGGPASLGAWAFSAAHKGQVLPVMYGRTRLSGSLIWYCLNDSGGGKKGGAEGDDRLMAFALCEGQVGSLLKLWANGEELDLDALDYNFYEGTGAPVADPIINANLAAGQVAARYPYTCYFVIGATKETNLSFELQRTTADLVAGNPVLAELGMDAHTENADGDMNPVVCLADFMTHPRYGLGFTASDFGIEYWEEEAKYCEFNDIYVSPVLDTLQDGFSHIEHLLSYFDGMLVFSQGVFKLHSRRSPAREALPYHVLYETDWIKKPVFSKSESNQISNTIAIEYLDRANDYNQGGPLELSDDWDIATRGIYRQQINLRGVTTVTVAGKIASKLLWSRVISPWNVMCELSPHAACYEPGDIFMASGASAYGLQDVHVRIISIEEKPEGTFIVVGQEER